MKLFSEPRASVIKRYRAIVISQTVVRERSHRKPHRSATRNVESKSFVIRADTRQPAMQLGRAD